MAAYRGWSIPAAHRGEVETAAAACGIGWAVQHEEAKPAAQHEEAKPEAHHESEAAAHHEADKAAHHEVEAAALHGWLEAVTNPESRPSVVCLSVKRKMKQPSPLE